MRLEDMRDAKARFARHIDINIDIGSWIENGSDPFIIVSEQVGKLRDAFSLNGFKNERHDVQLNRGLMKFNKIERAYFWVAHASRVSGLGVAKTNFLTTLQLLRNSEPSEKFAIARTLS